MLSALNTTLKIILDPVEIRSLLSLRTASQIGKKQPQDSVSINLQIVIEPLLIMILFHKHAKMSKN